MKTVRSYNGKAVSGAEARGGAASKKARRRKYEADPATLHEADQPTGRTLKVSEEAMRDLADAFGMTMGTGR